MLSVNVSVMNFSCLLSI